MNRLTIESQPIALIIDDEKAVRESIRCFLEDNDYTVFEAKSGRAGMDLFKNKDPDIVLLDLCMPGMNGLEVLSRLAEISSDTPTIVISGAPEIEDAVEAMRLGAYDYLTKPIKEMPALLHTMEKALEQSGLIQQNCAYQTHLEKELAHRTRELELTDRELRKANLRIKEQQQESIDEERLRALLQSAGVSTHELNQPLTVLLSCVEMLLMGNDLSKDRAQLIGRIHDAGRRMADIVKKIQNIICCEIKPYSQKPSVINPEQKQNHVFPEETEASSLQNCSRYLSGIFEWEMVKAKRYDTKLALCLIGPDNFKQVMDTYGRSAGNKFLANISNILKRCVRESDLCFRYGNEGFALIMPNTENEAGQIACERIRGTLNQNHFEYHSSRFRTSVSLGLATYMNSGPDNLPSMVEEAGKALYADREKREKQGGMI